MSDRLNKLHHQKALLEEHLKWLDQEILDASSSVTESKDKVEAKTTGTTKETKSPILNPSPPPPDEEFDKLILQYSDSGEKRMSAKAGCWLYVAIAFLLIGTLYFALWFLKYR